MKRIAIITYGMVFGGCEKVIATIANELSNENIECFIISIMNVESAYRLSKNVKLIKVAKQKGKQSGFNKIKCALKTRDIVNNLNPDIVLIMPEEISSIMIPFLLGLHIPIVVSERNNPWIRPINKVNRVLRRIFYRFADGYVFQTKEARSFFSKKIQNTSTIILNPLDLTRLPKSFPEVREKRVVAVGRLDTQKNHDLLIRAFAQFYKRYPEYKLDIYGNGDEKENLSQLAKSLLPHESYMFYEPTNEVLFEINNAAMFVLSSDYEGLPNALIEAMSIGLPCISTDCPSGGPRELIKSGINGILVPVNNDTELTNAMIKIAEDKEFSRVLGNNAYNIRNLVETNKIIHEWSKYLESKCKKS